MPVVSRDSVHVLPSLSDYGRALWRHKAIVATAVLVGVLAGVLLLPHLASAPEYQLTQRVDVRALTPDRLSSQAQALFGQTRAKAAGSTVIQTTPLDPGLVPDITALQQVLFREGSPFGELEVIHGVKPSLWLGTVAQNLVALPVPGTTQIDVSFTDPDPQLASDLVGSYVRAYANRRNLSDQKVAQQAQRQLQASYNSAQTRATDLGRQADTEAGRSAIHQASATTLSQLDAVRSRMTSLQSAIDQITSSQSLQGLPTEVLGDPTVTQPGRRPGKTLFIATGILLGVLIGVALALMVDALRPKIVTPEDAEEATGLRVAGSVPVKARGERSLVVQDRPLGPTAEGFHWMRTSLERQGVGRDANVVAILSAEGREGRSTVAANLALSLARQGRTTVLVCADLRGGGAERLFGIPATSPGLSDVVDGSEAVVTRLLWSVGEHLWVLPPGKSAVSPAELLASPRFPKALAKLHEDGAIVILDTPPATWSADALLIAGEAEAAVLVARSGATKRQNIAEMAEDLRAEGLKVLGIVVLGVKRPVRRVRQHLAKVDHTQAGPPPVVALGEWPSVVGNGQSKVSVTATSTKAADRAREERANGHGEAGDSSGSTDKPTTR